MYFLIDTDLFTRKMELIITCMSKVLVSKCIHNEKKGKQDHLERHWKFLWGVERSKASLNWAIVDGVYN